MAIDALMMLSDDKGPIQAESTTIIDTTDDFMTGFQAGKFFNIKNFKFGTQVRDSDTPPPRRTIDSDGEVEHRPVGQAYSKFVMASVVPTASSSSSGGNTLYPVGFDPFSFSREIEFSSPTLFQACFSTNSFVSGALVLRKAGGAAEQQASSAGVAAIPFFRIDFVQVLIVSIDWDGGDILTEECKFVCREVTIKYRQQKQSGQKSQKINTASKLTLVVAN